MSPEVEMVRLAAVLCTGLGLGILIGYEWRAALARREERELEREYARAAAEERRQRQVAERKALRRLAELSKRLEVQS